MDQPSTEAAKKQQQKLLLTPHQTNKSKSILVTDIINRARQHNSGWFQMQLLPRWQSQHERIN